MIHSQDAGATLRAVTASWWLPYRKSVDMSSSKSQKHQTPPKTLCHGLLHTLLEACCGISPQVKRGQNQKCPRMPRNRSKLAITNLGDAHRLTAAKLLGLAIDTEKPVVGGRQWIRTRLKVFGLPWPAAQSKDEVN